MGVRYDADEGPLDARGDVDLGHLEHALSAHRAQGSGREIWSGWVIKVEARVSSEPQAVRNVESQSPGRMRHSLRYHAVVVLDIVRPDPAENRQLMRDVETFAVGDFHPIGVAVLEVDIQRRP